jgi:hypothetical protein
MESTTGVSMPWQVVCIKRYQIAAECRRTGYRFRHSEQECVVNHAARGTDHALELLSHHRLIAAKVLLGIYPTDRRL